MNSDQMVHEEEDGFWFSDEAQQLRGPYRSYEQAKSNLEHYKKEMGLVRAEDGEPEYEEVCEELEASLQDQLAQELAWNEKMIEGFDPPWACED